MNILGISCFYHDSAAALVQDGLVVAAAEEERFTRVKHDSGFPARAAAFCLERAGITAHDLDYVVFYEKPLVKFERILLTSLRTYPRSWRTFGESMITWLDEKLWVKGIIARQLGVPVEKVLFTEHHMAHAASSFLCSPFDEAAVLTVDGVGEWTTTALGTATARWANPAPGSVVHDATRITLDQEVRFPHSLGLLYSAFTAFLGFEVNEGEYKVMGMAPYGEPRYQDEIYRLLRVEEDGSFELDLDYFCFHHSPERTFSRKFTELFGEPRDARADFVTTRSHPGIQLNGNRSAVERNQYYADVAASIQRVTEDVLLRMARHLHRRTGMRKLCLAGGVALNSVANGRILRETPFEELFIHPAAGDSGGAVGAALYVHHVVLGHPRRFVMENAYLGEEHSDGEARAFLDSQGAQYETFEDEDLLVDRLVDDLTTGKVLGVSQGRFEWGPRALGNRSIIADPRTAEMKDIVNTKIKFREPFRPFAPVLGEQHASSFFDGLLQPERQYPARYMLMVLPWQDRMSGLVPAVNHMGTGRLQTVRRDWNTRYYDLVDRFGQATGVPVLMNTSFNLRGEPMVSSPADAWKTFTTSGIDVLVLGNHVVRKPA